jgi:opacity protein-like surface antigen
METTMNKLNKLIASVIAMTFLSTPSIAGSGDFAGPFVQVSAVSIGAELDGQYTDGTGAVTKGTGGRIAQIGSIDIGYTIPLGESFLIGIGASRIPGSAEISKADDAANKADITIKAEDFMTYYIQPTISMSENSAVYLKLGNVEADLKVTGNFASASNSLDGNTYALGTKTMFSSGMYISAEAGYSEFDKINITDITVTGDSNAGDVTADPSTAFGKFSVGYKF